MKTLIQHQHANVIPFPYDRSCITTGIVHIGVGNFHRAHEEYYTNPLNKNGVSVELLY